MSNLLTRGRIIALFALISLMLVATPFTTITTSSYLAQNVPSVSPLATADFSLTANPTSLTMPAGATQSSVITATSLNGFVGTVYLAAFSYPLVVSLSSTSLTLSAAGTASSTVTVSATSTTPPGNHTIFIDATGGCALFHSADISARVTGPDFTVSAQKTQLTIAQGGSDTSKIDLASKNGFTGAVTLSAFTYPVTTSLLPTSITLASGGTGTSTLTVQASSIVEPGNYTVSVTASSGALHHSVYVDITVTGPTFAISAHQEFLSLLAGGLTNSSTITVSPAGGFSGPVSLTAGPLSFPPGLAVSIDKSRVTLPPTSTATLTLGAPLGTKTGFYFVDLTGNSSMIIKHASVFVTVKGPDFDVTADPFFLTVVAGGSSCTSLISVAPVQGFTGNVGLTWKAKSGLTATLDKSSVPVPGSATLTVSASVGTVPGFYSVDINGTSTSPPITHTTSVSVIVIGPDFSLSANPPALTVTAGSSAATSAIGMTIENGFLGVVGLKASSFGTGITTTLSVPSISGGATSTLSVTAATGTVPGDFYSVEVNGTNGALTHSIFIPVTVIGPDFSLSSNTASITFSAGTPTTSTITISPTLGFAAPVDLNAFSSSADLNASIAPTTVTSGSYTATLSVNSTIPGVYTVDIFASSGGLFHDLTIPVTVKGPDFTLSASPAALTIAAGSSKTSTITVGPLNGFASPVALTVSSPQGITASVNPTSITSPQTSTLTINVDPTTSPGPYTVDVQGTSGHITRDAFVTVNVASFILTANPDILTIDQGATQPSTITVMAQNGFTGTVQLTSSAPTGLMATLAATSTMGSGSTTLNIAASNSISPGTYAVNVTGTSGQLSQKATITVTVPVPDFTIAPAAPITVPCSVSTNCDTTITVTAQDGFNSLVTFTVSTSTPSGLPCTTAPPSVTGSGQTKLSCSSTTVGDYVVTVTGTSGSLQRTTSAITYHVVLGQDFSLSAEGTGPFGGFAGDYATVTIDVTAIGGFNGQVTFTVLPSTPLGLSCVTPQSVTGTGPTVLGCKSSVAADYTVIVKGTATINGSPADRVTGSIVFHVVDFTITANPIAVTVNAHAPGTSAITVAAANGFLGTVALSQNGGSSCTLSATSIVITATATSGSSTLTCTFAAEGQNVVTVTGAAATIRNTATATYTVNPVPDFTISATSPVSFASGSTGTSTVTGQVLHGFYSPVDLTASVSPSTGLSVSFNPQSFVYGFGTSTATFGSSTSGTYIVTITGTSGQLQHTATVEVTVSAPGTPDFSVTVNPASLTIQAGNNDKSTITIAPSYGFTDTVTLSTVVSAGPTVSLSTTSIAGGSGTSTLTVNVGSSVAAGTYTVTVTGTSGSLSHSTQVTITVTAAAQPTAPAPTILGLDPTIFYAIVGGLIALLVIGGVTLVVRRKNP